MASNWKADDIRDLIEEAVDYTDEADEHWGAITAHLEGFVEYCNESGETPTYEAMRDQAETALRLAQEGKL